MIFVGALVRLLGRGLALDKALEFMSDVSGPPEDEDEQRRVTSTLHALEHATRLAELAGEEAEFPTTKGRPEDMRAAQLCAEAMQDAASVASEVAPRRRLSTGRPQLNRGSIRRRHLRRTLRQTRLRP
jgi:hypothetical protein